MFTLNLLVYFIRSEMGALASVFHRHRHAVCPADASPEQGQRQGVSPPASSSSATGDDGGDLGRLSESDNSQEIMQRPDRTPLHWAIVAGKVENVRKLLVLSEAEEVRSMLEAVDEQGRSALHYAAEMRDAAAVSLLLGAGASPHAEDCRGRTALVSAADVGDPAVCEALLDGGSAVNASDHLGQAALHVAAERGSASVVRLLLQRGADARARDGCGRSALHCALQFSNVAAAEALLAPGAGGPVRDVTGRTELHWAAANATPEVVERLVEGGGDFGRDEVGMSPLIRALQARNRDTAGALLDACLCDDAPDMFGRTALHWAAYAGFPELVRRLLEQNFSPWSPDLCGRDALMWAVEIDEQQVVATILERAGYRERADGHGQTALHIAASRGNAAAASSLLEHGADADTADFRGRVPLVYALRAGHREAARVLLDALPDRREQTDCSERTLLHWAAVSGDECAVRQLLARGARVNAQDACGQTAAALAVEHSRLGAARLLVQADGFRVSRDRRGRTPLHGAAAAGWAEVAARLCALGANPHDGDEDCQSAVMLAVRSGHYTLARDISRLAEAKPRLQ